VLLRLAADRGRPDFVRQAAIPLAALWLTACGAEPRREPGPAVVGQTLHYVRSNIDGTQPEHVYMHRSAPDRIAVYKMVAPCTHAALVTATVDPGTGEASRLEAASLQPDGTGEPYGTLLFDGERLTAKVDMDGQAIESQVQVESRPWHLYDYDLATLAAMTQATQPEGDFDFSLALVWVDPANPGDFLRWLGAAHARLAGEETHEGRMTRRFEVEGAAFGSAGGGPMWLDSVTGRIVDVQWHRPNHSDYTSFRLRLVGEEPGGEAAWDALMRRHFAGCPA